ncbi:zinc finger MYM-type protein [Trifolium repens]|nr:zinc finger MYM-type protein [Trifolium repens]
MELVHDVKARLATMKEGGWDNLSVDIQNNCVAKGIPVPDMDEEIPIWGRSKLEERTVINLHHYRAEIFYVAIDKICVETDHPLCLIASYVLTTRTLSPSLILISLLDRMTSLFYFDL